MSANSIDALMEELLREKPNEKRVREYMTQVGLTYSTDSITRMEAILNLLDSQQKKRVPRRIRKDHEPSL